MIERLSHNDDRQILRNNVPVIADNNGQPYAVRIAEVPQPWQNELREWWQLFLLPLFNPDGCGDCIYVWDWADWLDGYVPDIP